VSGALERFAEAARIAGLEVEVQRFPEGTKTAADAARAVGCDVAQIVKSLVFVDGEGEPILALTSGAHRVDTAALATVAGVGRVDRATPERAREATGFAVGGTPPFGHPSPIRTYLDPELLRHEVVWAAAGTPEAIFPIAPTRLKAVTHAVEADFT
jgi:prolyl-tRNA editing enzyme YbaK/EbsC (Cys-tRNA(Pro) deacylase)